MIVVCQNCQAEYPEGGFPTVCPKCGGRYVPADLPVYDPKLFENSPGLWRYRRMIGFDDDHPVVTLGEGRTPLVEDRAFGHTIFCKLDYLNPTGSCKDRAFAVIINHLVKRGITSAVIESMANAGPSFAAYTARAGIRSRVFVPHSTVELQRQAIEQYGADWTGVKGGIEAARQAALDATPNDYEAYASPTLLPFGMDGYATLAYELFEALGRTIGTVIAPVGYGHLLMGMLRGFQSLLDTGFLEQIPAIVGVYSQYPATHAWAEGPLGSRDFEGNAGSAVQLERLQENGGSLIQVREDEIPAGVDQLARHGYFVETTSAMVWAGLKDISANIQGPVVLLLTGTKHKFRS